ncbi:flagellar basal body rod protein FlgC [Altererythrobacter sp. JGD-16]|uniref:Flagellar basal-body rod protein FlgC n=2 Tax=Altererythrobacter lutimaris TaxID=2743979 RepID=A0A850H8L8_9SPHN|nr:flagellar basal body rod protein FlgC [Altererythrobacter lutimaris]NVE93301.1 flagellar basal body rod protein FlgC [Altererythrobacter lutimaris]
MNIFDVAQRSMSAQMVRMNVAASNLANAGSVSASAEEAYRPLRTVFESELDRATGLSGVRVGEVIRSEVQPTKRHDPNHPLADANGDVWEAPVDEASEMVELMESARQYQNVIGALQTAKQLMLETLRSR